MRIVLEALSKAKRDPIGEAWVPSEKLSKDINLESADLNDAIELLHEQGLVKCLQVPDSSPFICTQVAITARGRLTLQKNTISPKHIQEDHSSSHIK